jgi:hypothetical protein
MSNPQVNGHDYTMACYLVDYIYSSWIIFVKTIQAPENKQNAQFSKAQETCQNDIERGFGVLQVWFAIIGGPTSF